MYELSPDYCKRDYLLPPGCNELIDLLVCRRQSGSLQCRPLESASTIHNYSGQGFTVELKPLTTVNALAEVLLVKPIKVVAGLLELGTFASLHQLISFDSASKLLAKSGLSARKAA
jgi:hypothetical protein